ncbi:MAG: hypothetical protein AABY64_02640 [Bdellovibrionota bacterium]
MILNKKKLAAILLFLTLPQMVMADELVNRDIDYNRYCVSYPLTEDTINCSIGWGGSSGLAPAASCQQSIELIDMHTNYYKKIDLRQVEVADWGAGIFSALGVGLILDVPHQLVLRNEVKTLLLQKMEEANRHSCALIGYVPKARAEVQP